ncbi:MAG TPA: xanthine dehydrogenase family protein molybdopterin-binding subunit [Alphaproteobacteria bacterium]|nr:xanthine dehydrogenase family protein molybdopterin-binding subunit [Alphaproteobacteria bacterium]
MAYNLIGKNFTPPDVHAKVTGRAKYSEDIRADGMLFIKLLTSPMPHAQVKKIDAAEALKMPGVVAVLTPDDVPQFPPPADPILYSEPLFVGAPILAVAAVDELTAANAIEKIKVDLQPLPFTLDPLDSLYPAGPNARTSGNVANVKLKLQTVKWEAADFARAGDSKLPQGKPAEEWSYGDLEAGFKAAKVVIEESFVTAGYSHHSMEPRSAMAMWQNGKCILHGSSQSQTFIVPEMARYIGIKPEDLIYVAEYCGGGFGSKGTAYPLMSIPAHMSKKTGRPVMMRVTRAEEYALGSARPGFQGYIKMGFRADGRMTACDVYVVHDNGPNMGFWDFRNAGETMSVVYQPLAMRWRGISVLTNSPPRGPQRGPGENQTAAAIEPLIDKAARQLGIDRVAIRNINAPDANGKIGEEQDPLTSSYLKEALEIGKQKFNWDERIKKSGQRKGSKVTGVGVGQAFHTAGAAGFDGITRITPDGKVHIHSGVGNLGTYSYASTARIAAEAIGANWDDVVIERGDMRRALPWALGQFGSNTNYTMARSNYVGAMDARAKLLEIAAKDLGGTPEDYDVANMSVVHKTDKSKSMTFAKAAQRAIELGGKYSGKEVPENLNPITKGAVAMIAGTGLIGAAKDTLPKKGQVPTFTATFVEVELDTETGHVDVVDCLGVTDCGTVIHPQNLDGQIKGGNTMGIGMARMERHVYDPKLGLPANVGLYQTKPPSYLDVPAEMKAAAVDKPDGQSPMGTKGMGEPPLGSAAAAVICAISDALGGTVFNRTPVSPDMILSSLNNMPQAHKPLQVNTV